MKPARNYWSPADEAALLAMREQGMTNAEIARKLGCSKSAVAHKISKLTKAAPQAAADPEEEEPGATDLERELAHTQELCDKLMAQLEEISATVNGNVAVMMKTVGEQGNALIEHGKAIAVLQNHAGTLIEEARIVKEYLGHSGLWRLFHGFAAFWKKALQDEAQS